MSATDGLTGTMCAIDERPKHAIAEGQGDVHPPTDRQHAKGERRPEVAPGETLVCNHDPIATVL